MANKYNYNFTPLAEEDVDSVLTYLSEKLLNGKAAVDLFAKIERTVENICEFPYSYADCSYFLITDENIRRAVIDNYVLVYEVVEETKQINFLRFRYAKMNLMKININDKK